MSRGLILTAGLLAAGCSSDPPPIREAAPVSGEKAALAAFDPPAKPAQSDPAAAKLVAAALAAHGATDPATLAKLKSVSLHRVGLTSTKEGIRAPLDWRADFQAPGRCRVDASLKHPGGPQNFTIILAPNSGTIAEMGKPDTKTPITSEALHDCNAQRSEDEFMLLFPLADPETVAVPAADVVVNGSPAVGVYVWTPALSPALVHFDKKTGRIVRVVYRGRENYAEMLKQITVREHGQFGGVWLPTKFELLTNGRLFLDVEKQTFEIGKTFDADRFKP